MDSIMDIMGTTATKFGHLYNEENSFFANWIFINVFAVLMVGYMVLSCLKYYDERDIYEVEKIRTRNKQKRDAKKRKIKNRGRIWEEKNKNESSSSPRNFTDDYSRLPPSTTSSAPQPETEIKEKKKPESQASGPDTTTSVKRTKKVGVEKREAKCQEETTDDVFPGLEGGGDWIKVVRKKSKKGVVHEGNSKTKPGAPGGKGKQQSENKFSDVETKNGKRRRRRRTRGFAFQQEISLSANSLQMQPQEMRFRQVVQVTNINAEAAATNNQSPSDGWIHRIDLKKDSKLKDTKIEATIRRQRKEIEGLRNFATTQLDAVTRDYEKQINNLRNEINALKTQQNESGILQHTLNAEFEKHQVNLTEAEKSLKFCNDDLNRVVENSVKSVVEEMDLILKDLKEQEKIGELESDKLFANYEPNLESWSNCCESDADFQQLMFSIKKEIELKEDDETSLVLENEKISSNVNNNNNNSCFNGRVPHPKPIGYRYEENSEEERKRRRGWPATASASSSTFTIPRKDVGSMTAAKIPRLTGSKDDEVIGSARLERKWVPVMMPRLIRSPAARRARMRTVGANPRSGATMAYGI